MANDITTLPWILDTAAIITTAWVHIKRMEFIPSVSTDDVQIEDKNGRVIWARKAVFTNESPVQVFDTPMWVNGFELAVIDGGTLYVYLGE